MTVQKIVWFLLKKPELKPALARLLGPLGVSMLSGDRSHPMVNDEVWAAIQCEVPEHLMSDLMAVFAQCVIFDAVVEVESSQE